MSCKIFVQYIRMLYNGRVFYWICSCQSLIKNKLIIAMFNNMGYLFPLTYF